MIHQPHGRFLLILCSIAIVLIALTIAPFAAAFFAAAVIAAALIPLEDRWSRSLRGRRHLAAGLITAGVVLCVLLPLATLSLFLVQEAQKTVGWIQDTIAEKGLDGVIESLPSPLRTPAKHVIAMVPADALGIEPSEASDEHAREKPADDVASPSATTPDVKDVASALTAAVRRIGSVLVQLGVFVLALFFLLAEGPRLVDYLVNLAPLEEARSRTLLSSFRSVSVGVLLSVLATAAAQTIVAAIGFVIASVPALPLVLLATFFCSFIPSIGGAGVTIAAGIILALSGRPGMGVFLVVWGATLVATIDNIIKPWIARDRVQLPGSVVFFAMICGLAAFGALGLVAGPLIVVFFDITTRMMRRHQVEHGTKGEVEIANAPPT